MYTYIYIYFCTILVTRPYFFHFFSGSVTAIIISKCNKAADTTSLLGEGLFFMLGIVVRRRFATHKCDHKSLQNSFLIAIQTKETQPLQ